MVRGSVRQPLIVIGRVRSEEGSRENAGRASVKEDEATDDCCCFVEKDRCCSIEPAPPRRLDPARRIAVTGALLLHFLLFYLQLPFEC